MNSLERVRKAINPEEADRVPIDIGGTKVTGVHVDHYVALGRYLGLDVEPPKVYEQFQMLARLDDAVRNWLAAGSCSPRLTTFSTAYRPRTWRR